METLDKTTWDVLISGTGIRQSLLALALSRSGKKVLHIDKNDYYGGPEAAFSLQEAQEWESKVARDTSPLFSNVKITQRPEQEQENRLKLSASRAYSLSLSPQLIYSRSTLLSKLVSSKIYRQLEFLAVGSWWVYSPSGHEASSDSAEPSQGSKGTLSKVPSGREDVFEDQILDLRSKRALMKFLRFVVDYENQGDVWEEHRDKPFSIFLSENFNLPTVLHDPILALTLSLKAPENTSTEYALPRIARHLRSIGVFGPGFGAVLPRWGGVSEISQVACRAGAVGGAVYVLDKGLRDTLDRPVAQQMMDNVASSPTTGTSVVLEGGETVRTQWIAGSRVDLPASVISSSEDGLHYSDLRVTTLSRSISIVGSPLESLFPDIAEGAPPPAGAVVFFPSGSLSVNGELELSSNRTPVYIFVHSSDSGECPSNQCVLYASCSTTSQEGSALLAEAVRQLLLALNGDPASILLWSLSYDHRAQDSKELDCPPASYNDNTIAFSSSSSDLAFEDSVLEEVKLAWEKIMSGEPDAGDFMVISDPE
ncbi:rab geranylgeranyl transferase escort protein, partial [Patellaria atrata CBS 101060]